MLINTKRNPGVLLAVLLLSSLCLAGGAGAATPLGANDDLARESLAYSQAMQAFLYAYPLTIADRELRRREKLKAPVRNAPMAPVNRLGHMSQIADADTDMPYSPNNDTVYTGVLLDLSLEPIILRMPEIKDRYAVIQIANGYFENQPYEYSPRVNGGDAVDLAFVGPDWHGTLPKGVKKVAMDTVHAFLAIRIALDGAHELDTVRAYQNQMSLTALSDWDNGPTGKLPAQPAPRKRPDYSGPFAFFEQAADLMAINPPPPRHHAINASLWRVGLFPGQPFDPDVLDPATRRGVQRALADAPTVIDYLSRNRGKRFPNGWDVGRYADDIVFDYAVRAAMALVGLMGNDPEEAIYLYTYYDANGDLLDAGKRYRIHFEPGTVPSILEKGFWSLTMYDGKNYRYVHNPIDRYAVGSRTGLTYNEDGSLDLWIQPTPPGEDKMTNWLPTSESAEGSFRVTLRIYGPDDRTVEELYDIELAIPPLEPLD